MPHVGGIATGGKIGDLELDLVALLPAVPLLGRALAGGVGVVRQHHLAGEVLEDLEVVVGERGATGGAPAFGAPASAKAMTSV